MNTRGKAQIEGLQKIVHRARSRDSSFNPQIIYVQVIKKTPKRVYKHEPITTQKFAPEVHKNPNPGTVIYESISSDNIYDFHLTAQNVTEGTSTLTQFQVAYDASEIPEEALAQFTLEQCYNYPNWLGGIRVPGCLQGSNKLSKLVGEHIHQNIDKNSQRRPFYL